MVPLSLYIHLPWCVRKCPYCDFNSHEATTSLPEELYVATLLRDLDEQLLQIEARELVSIFFGGGTPSLFSPQSIEKILRAVEKRFDGLPTEITLEANPGTVDESRFKGFREAGVNRLSLGIQSLQNEKLKILGRIHDREYALRAIENAIHSGFENINLDLMHGLPGQTVEDALSDLEEALNFNLPHLSWYQLTIEPNTFFHHQPPILPAEDMLWDIQEQGKQKILAAGLHQYEVSAYSKQNKNCQHNRHYWEFGDYLGIGAGAHSKITRSDKTIFRHWQVKHPKDYLDPQKKLTANQSLLTQNDIVFEFMLNALRLTEGVTIKLFLERTGLSSHSLEPMLSQAKEKKLLCDHPERLQPTELGQRFLNDLVSIFLPTRSVDNSLS